MNIESFTDFLLRQTPVYDREILKDITPTSSWLGTSKRCLDLLRRDVRFLPNNLRPLWAFRKDHPKMLTWQIGKRFRIKRNTVEDRLCIAEEIIYERLNKWLKSLPQLQRRRERYARQKSWEKRPKGWKPVMATGQWPDLSSSWIPAKDKAIGTTDPWAPMRHWDD